MLEQLKKELKSFANEDSAKILQRYFKTGKGEYGKGDVFLGLRSQQVKDVAKKYSGIPLIKIQELLKSQIHEERMCALRILVQKYENSEDEEKANIFNFYLKNTKKINNWDLVDISSHCIIGDFLSNKNKKILYELAKSDNLWERRIAIISTLNFIKKENMEDTLEIAKLLLDDSHDLIHKAVGWMLREVGKKDVETLKYFLEENYDKIPRTTLRYAIERFEDGERKKLLKGKFKNGN
jgi:3-methyladenine DNA glycosylase AlkD